MVKSKGSTLLVVLMIALVALSIALSIMMLTTSKTNIAVNNKYSLQAYYAAEAGIQEAIDTMTDNIQLVVVNQVSAEGLDLPSVNSPQELNGSEYYVTLTYDTEEIIVTSIGSNGHAKKGIQVKLEYDIDPTFDFGLLSRDTVTVHTGNITYGLDIHGNGENGGSGLDFKGNTRNYNAINGAEATQSVDTDGFSNATSYYGNYRPEVSVPSVDFDEILDGMFGASEPGTSETDLSVVLGLSDNDTDVIFNSDYLYYNKDLDMPEPSISNNKTKKNSYIAKLNEHATNTILALNKSINKDNTLTLLSNSAFKGLDFIIKPLSLNIIYLYYDYPKHIIAGGKGNAKGQDNPDPTPEPTPVPTVAPEPTPEPTTEPTPVPTEDPGDDSSSSKGNSGNNSGNSSGSQQGGQGDISLYLQPGDYGGKVIYIDNESVGTLNVSLGGIVSNATIVATGEVIFNGADRMDRGNASGLLDFAILAGGDITHNGSMDTGCFYWLNGSFRQNGRSDFDNGRVMAQGTITMNGRFSLTTDYELNEFDWLPKRFVVKSWKEIPVNNS